METKVEKTLIHTDSWGESLGDVPCAGKLTHTQLTAEQQKLVDIIRDECRYPLGYCQRGIKELTQGEIDKQLSGFWKNVLNGTEE
ncbi:hypothetical protein M1563_00655 [Patescibacteria group bacterium]|nr:hypothetical protein [Patescibacteria group bacterium]MCL5410128.1 hypothetical protein [Patescibacteria group bacterium]